MRCEKCKKCEKGEKCEERETCGKCEKGERLTHRLGRTLDRILCGPSPYSSSRVGDGGARRPRLPLHAGLGKRWVVLLAGQLAGGGKGREMGRWPPGSTGLT